jgi:hypothetical protein
MSHFLWLEKMGLMESVHGHKIMVNEACYTANLQRDGVMEKPYNQ